MKLVIEGLEKVPGLVVRVGEGGEVVLDFGEAKEVGQSENPSAETAAREAIFRACAELATRTVAEKLGPNDLGRVVEQAGALQNVASAYGHLTWRRSR